MIEIYRGMPGDAMPTVSDVTAEDVAFYLDPEATDVPELHPNEWLASETARLKAIIAGDDRRAVALAQADLSIRMAIADPARAHELSAAALAVGEELSDPLMLATAHHSLGLALWMMDFDWRRPSNHALQAEYLFHDLGLPEWEASAMALRRYAMVVSGSEASAIAMEPAILELLRRPGTDSDEYIRFSCAASVNHASSGIARRVKQDLQLEQRHLALVVAYGRVAPEPLIIAYAHATATTSAGTAKRYAAARAHANRVNRIAIRNRGRNFQVDAMQLLASIHIEENDFVAAGEVIAAGESLLNQTSDDAPLAPPLLAFRRIQLLIAQKRWDEAEQMLDEHALQVEGTFRWNIESVLESYIQIYRAKGTLCEHLDVYDRLLQEIRRNADERLAAQRQAAEDQRDTELRKKHQRSDRLLQGILPPSAYAEVVECGESEPRYYPRAVVFFSDFAGFTRIAAALTPRQVIEELSDLFANFDSIMEENGCERIETIGDAYLAVAGLKPESGPGPVPRRRESHGASGIGDPDLSA